MKEGGKVMSKKLGKQGLKRFFGSNAGTAVAFAAMEQVHHTVNLFRGKTNHREYLKHSARNVGSAGAAYGGAVGGAALGTLICPGVGTAIGAFAGAMGGGLGGGTVMGLVVSRE